MGPDFNDGLQAGMTRMDPDLKARLLEELRAGPKPLDPREAAREAAADARREMLDRGLAEAVKRGDVAKAEKYREAIANLPPPKGLVVRDEGEKIVLEKRPKSGSVSVLPHADEPIPEPKSVKLPDPDQDRTLNSAIGELSGVPPSNGAGDGIETAADSSEHFRRLEEWAQKSGVVYDGLNPVLEGGREHDLILDAATGTVLKFTKPSKAAYVVSFEFGSPRLIPALPLEYLERQALHNEIFSDNITFVGLGGDLYNRRIITRQNHIIGIEAYWDKIIELMVENLGFTKLRHNFGIGYEDSYAFVCDGIAVFDMRPPNVIVTPSGIIVPIDSIPVRLTDETRAMLIP